jgi:hypothetical protein
MPFEWDIFLSYGWSGNASGEGDRAWVTELAHRISVRLRTALGRDPKIFLDSNATRAGALTPILESALDQSRLFLFVVSPGACHSDWCKWEILRFLDRGYSAATRTEVLLPEDRILGVLLEAVEREAVPEPLQPLVFRPYDLTRPVAQRSGRQPVDWEQVSQFPPVQAEFDRLIDDVKDRLRTVERHEREFVPQTGVIVFLGTAPTAVHEREYLTPLRRDILLRGHRAVRGSAAPGETESDYRIRMGEVLSHVDLSVHILGQPVTPPGWLQPVSAWQLRRAGELKNVSLFTWVDPDGEADPRELSEIIQKGDHHFDRRQPFSDLRTALLERAAGRARQKETAVMAAGLSVVIAYCEEDRPSVSAVKQRLQQKHGFQVQLALPPRDGGGQRNRINKSLFGEVDAVMVYYSRHEEWMVFTCATVRKVFREKNRNRPAALVLDPPPPQKEDCDQLQFASLRRASPTDFDAIDGWADCVKGANE